MTNVQVFAFDGLHNNGKTTQVSLLKDRLESEGHFVVMRRGGGSRKGEGKEEFDPYSTWWLENRPRILAAGFEGERAERASMESTDRLNRELHMLRHRCMERELRRGGTDSGIILLDRSLISTLSVRRRYRPDAGYSDMSRFSSKRGVQDIVVPDTIFLLHAPQEVLLARNHKRGDGAAKRGFNDTVLTRYYDEFQENVDCLPREIQDITVPVSTDRTIQEVNDDLFRRIVNLSDNRGRPEGSMSMGIEKG